MRRSHEYTCWRIHVCSSIFMKFISHVSAPATKFSQSVKFILFYFLSCCLFPTFKLRRVQIQKVPLIFNNNFCKCAWIFIIYSMQLCKWLLNILINLLLHVSRTKLTRWRYVDVDEITPFTDEDIHYKMLSYRRETVLRGGLVMAQNGRLEQGDNIYGNYRSIFNHCDVIGRQSNRIQ